MKRLLIVLAALLAPALASAQAPVPNPKTAEFTVSLDHNNGVTAYEIGWFLGAATEPVSVSSLGKPTPDASNTASVTINVMPLGFDIYTAKVRAVAGAVYSEWSAASNPFARIPGPPGGPTVKK